MPARTVPDGSALSYLAEIDAFDSCVVCNASSPSFSGTRKPPVYRSRDDEDRIFYMSWAAWLIPRVEFGSEPCV